jgi:hypothetical protein
MRFAVKFRLRIRVASVTGQRVRHMLQVLSVQLFINQIATRVHVTVNARALIVVISNRLSTQNAAAQIVSCLRKSNRGQACDLCDSRSRT